MIKVKILDRSNFWVCGERFNLPDCMREGSLEEVLEMMSYDITFDYFTARRCVHDV